jgi:IMP cyclohydrolase
MPAILPVYRGRYIAIGKLGVPTALYRVASRSFPNRRIDVEGAVAQVVPSDNAEKTGNPFISYRCYIQTAPDTVVVANGSQIDQVVSKLRRGCPMKDALMLALLANDFEDDGHATPRIVGALQGSTGFVGSVGAKHVGVYAFALEAGVFMEVSTNACPATVIGRVSVSCAKPLSAQDLAADLSAGKIFAPDPHFVTGLAWSGGSLAVYNRVDH